MGAQASISQLRPFFEFPFQDRPSKSRFLIGSALLLASFIVPIVPGLIVYGYVLRILRRTAGGEPPAMPVWDDWAGDLSRGFRGAMVNLVYAGPALVVFLVGLGLYFATFFMIPLADRPGADASEETIALTVLLAMASMFGSMAIGSVLLVVGTLPLPAAVSHFAATDQLAAAFRVREWGAVLWANRFGYLVSFIVVAGILGITYFAFFIFYSTLILLCVGYLLLIPLSLYTFLVGAAFFGSAYREGVAAIARE